jgi:IS5 family transposase
MSQVSLADAEYAGKWEKTSHKIFFSEIDIVLPWKMLLKLISPHHPVAGFG